MKVMSFNTQHCLGYVEQKINYQLMADTIIKCGADIVGLNEMRSDDENTPYDRQAEILSELTELKYHYFAKAIEVKEDDISYSYGNAIISRYPIISAETILIPDPVPKKGETRCILKAKLENGVTVLVTHFGLREVEQENAVSTVIDNIEKEKCILMGDFNLTPENEIINPIRERMVDTACKFESKLLSFPSDIPDRKIDYIFATSDMKILDADIPVIVASDHRPHTAEIDI